MVKLVKDNWWSPRSTSICTKHGDKSRMISSPEAAKKKKQ
jgi:hypothetical protein